MHLLLKSAEGVYALAAPVYLAMYVVLYAALRHVRRPGPRRRTALIAILTGIACLHGAPLLVLANILANDALRGTAGDGIALADHLQIYAVHGALIIAAQALVLLVPFRIARFVAERKWSERRHEITRAFAFVVLGVTIACAVWVPLRIRLDMTSVNVDEHDLPVAHLPAALDGYRIGVIADVQMDEVIGDRRMHEYVDAMNAEKPDIILFAGDLVTWKRSAWEAAQPFRALNATQGIYACLGDHDEYNGADSVTAALRSIGVAVLRNSTVRVPVRGSVIDITGMTSVFVDRATPERLDSAMRSVLGAGSPLPPAPSDPPQRFQRSRPPLARVGSSAAVLASLPQSSASIQSVLGAGSPLPPAPSPRGRGGDQCSVLASLPQSSASNTPILRVLLLHQLTDALGDEAARRGMNLITAGHTHGGQVGLWFYGMTLTSSMLDTRYVSGFSWLGSSLVYVCNGLGMSVVKVRYGVTPSVGVIRLVRG